MNTRKFKSLAYFLLALSSVAGFGTGFASSASDKVEEVIDTAAQAMKRGIDKLGDSIDDIQDYFEHYHWKGVLEDSVSFDKVTLENLELNGHPKAIVVKPGERIEGRVHCILDRKQCSAAHFYRIVLGIKGQGAQTTIGNEFGLIAGESNEKFVLVAPEKPDLYQVRFRLVSSLFKGHALEAWEDEEGNEPDGKTTIAFILVKS